MGEGLAAAALLLLITSTEAWSSASRSNLQALVSHVRFNSQSVAPLRGSLLEVSAGVTVPDSSSDDAVGKAISEGKAVQALQLLGSSVPINNTGSSSDALLAAQAALLLLLSSERRHKAALTVWQQMGLENTPLGAASPVFTEQLCCAVMLSRLALQDYSGAVSVLDWATTSSGSGGCSWSPGGSTYGLALQACERVNKRWGWKRAVALVSELESAGVQLRLQHVRAAVVACSKTKQWSQAVQLLAKLRAAQITPDVRTMTAAISSCTHKQAEAALSLMQEMRSDGLGECSC
jgi:hypothetical protein